MKINWNFCNTLQRLLLIALLFGVVRAQTQITTTTQSKILNYLEFLNQFYRQFWTIFNIQNYIFL